ncbi:MAG: protein kinase domain-containing protein [Anaerolineae bacterium]
MIDESFYKQTTIPDFHHDEHLLSSLPQKIGPYKIEGLLSKGGMSFLYLGLHPETRQPLAVKVLSPKYVTHQESVERFLREAEIIALSNHPNIVKLFGQGEWEGGLYIAMELIRGISLRQFIIQQSLSLRRTLDIILQVAYALCHLHGHGVIHRDLKPENILITEDGEIKVIDFGIAQLHDEFEERSKFKEQGVVGTPSYMSPEQKENPSKVSFSSDIYSLGIITYELLIGKLSFGIINLTLLPKGLQKIASKALAISMQERYLDIVDFITDISQYLKSGLVDKDKPGTDQWKEALETLQRAHTAFCLTPPPDWEDIEIGIAKFRGGAQLSLYYDFFHLPDNSYGVLLAKTSSSELDAALYTAAIQGMVHMYLHDKMSRSKEPFIPQLLLQALNQMFVSQRLLEPIFLSFLHLKPSQDLLSFICCGEGSLFHLARGSREARKLDAQNPCLAQESLGDFLETSDNWAIGDTLIIQSLEAFSDLEALAKERLETTFKEALAESYLLTAERQAEAILKKAIHSSHFASQKYPQALIAIQRIS